MNASSSSIGFPGLLLPIAFIVLKLIGVITWSWWWVLAPIWGALGLFLAVFVVVLVGMLVCKKVLK